MREKLPAAAYSQYKESTHLNLIQQLKQLSLGGHNDTSSTGVPAETYGNGIAESEEIGHRDFAGEDTATDQGASGDLLHSQPQP